MKKGFSLIELLLAFVILTSAVIASVLAAYEMPAIIQNAYTEAEAAGIAHARIERMALFARSNFSQLTSVATTSIDSITTYLRVLPIDESALHVLSASLWTSSEGIAQSVTNDALITDYKHVTDHPCQPFVSGDWTHPRILNSYKIAASYLLPASTPNGQYPVSALAVQGNVLAVAIATTTNFSDPSLLFFRIGDPSLTPTFIDSFDNTPQSKIGFTALAAGGGNVYAANGFGSMSTSTCGNSFLTCAQLQIFTTIGTVPLLAGAAQIPTTSPARALSANGAIAPADAVAYRAGMVYLGLAKTAGGQEFQIIDVQNPNALKRLGGASAGRGVNAIAVSSTTAYLATDDNATGGKAIIAEDISDNAHPIEMTSHSFPGAGFVRTLIRAGTVIYSGRSYANGTSEEFSVLDQSTLTRITGVDTGTNLMRRGVTGIIVRDFLAFLLTDDQLQLWNLQDMAAPVLYASLPLLHGTATSMVCRQNALYIGSVDTDGSGYLTVVTSS
ncbi:MAG: hypothetical protein JWL88_4 [Parcubacteria group bacterium]|nr:hypothetical protein [Parcubacteria group bacterium]